MKWLKKSIPYLIIFILVILIRTFIITPVRVDGVSMYPTLKNKDIIIVKKYDKKYQYGDIVILNYGNSKLVKRIIGVPGDFVEIKKGTLYINRQKVEDPYSALTNDFSLEQLGYEKIPDDYYFVMGDNRQFSSDSRMIGLIQKKDIQGVTSFRLFPFNHFGTVK